MNWRAVLIISLGLNLVLGAWWLRSRSQSGPAASETSAGPVAAPDGHQPAYVTVTNVGELRMAATGEVAWPTWSQLADDDLMVQRTNLLAIECPPDTVRDILTLTIDRQRTQAREVFMLPHLPRFWDLVAAGGLQHNTVMEGIDDQLAEHLQPYAALAERVLHGLENADVALDQERNPGHDPGPEYRHLSQEKQRELARLQRELEEGRAEIRRQHGDGKKLSPEGIEKERALAAEYDRKHRELLTPEEALEARLRKNGATEWAAELRGFEPSPEELRTIAVWRDKLEIMHALMEETHPEAAERQAARSAAERSLDDQTRELLGEERFAQLQRARDERFAPLYDVGLRFALPEATVNQAWQMQQDAGAAAQLIRDNQALTPVQRRDTLRTIQQETQQAFQNLFGDEPFQTYQEHGGGWLRDLGRLTPRR
ncbi:MAG TPA: hypothetical protein DCY13_09265 [Verrucomicrobiales bacterium]|nr:hypothetical protein [Verrucomicrobiales bacterium]